MAVISITLFRILSRAGLRNATVLENNIVQTAGSAGESIAFGVGITMGVMIAVVLELAGIPSLAFAVGVYLPLSASTPILMGGLIRRLVDGGSLRRMDQKTVPPARGDQGPGVLLASGYIAGGAIAGIVIAFMAGVLGDVNRTIETWATVNNPVFAGTYSDLLSPLPFAVIALLLLLVGRRLVPPVD